MDFRRHPQTALAVPAPPGNLAPSPLPPAKTTQMRRSFLVEFAAHESLV